MAEEKEKTEGEAKEVQEEKKRGSRRGRAASFDKDTWQPRTSIGKKTKSGEITTIDYILDSRLKILEQGIVDSLMPDLASDLLLIGQSKGKFGGGQRRVFRQTQKKTREGNKPRFGTFAIVGNQDGYVGIGYGKSKETVPAREKALRDAKLNMIKIMRGCGSWQCACKNPHSVPYIVGGKSGSVSIKLIPAPRGTGLCVEGECRKILGIAGIKDVWSQTFGQTRTKINLINACFDALRKLAEVKIHPDSSENLGLVEGPISKTQ